MAETKVGRGGGGGGSDSGYAGGPAIKSGSGAYSDEVVGGASPGVDGIADSFKGRGQSLAVEIPANTLIRLPDIPCRYVLMSVWNVDNSAVENYASLSAEDLYENAGLEVYYGFGQSVAHQLFPTQSSPLLPVTNLNQIVAKMQIGAAAGVLYITYFE